MTVRGPYHSKDFKSKNYGGTGLISKKTEALYLELNERAEAATNNFSLRCCSLTMINICDKNSQTKHLDRIFFDS